MAALEESIAAVKEQRRRRQGGETESARPKAAKKSKAKAKSSSARTLQSQSLEIGRRPWARPRQVEVDGRELKLTNLDKVLYPKAGFTKGEVVDYYAKVAPAMVPHLSGRAVTLRRFPEGVDDLDAAFFEKRCPKHRPKWVKTATVQAGPQRRRRSTSASATACRR